MSGLHPDYSGRTEDGPSNAIWSRFDGLKPGTYYEFFEDFLSFNLEDAVATNVGTYVSGSGGWGSYEDTGGSIAQLVSEIGGVVRLTTDATDNDEVWLRPGSATTVMGKVTASAGAMMAFEARIRMNTIASRNIFIGLAEENLAAADTISDTGVIADKDYIAFNSLEGDAAGMDFGYVKAGGTDVALIDDGLTLVASTWYKVGFLFLPQSGNKSKRIRVFFDGEEHGTGVTQTQLEDTTNFPGGEELTILAGVKNGTTAATQLDIDWVRFAQVR